MDHVTGDEVIEVEESTGAADSCFECEDQAEVLPSELDGGAASGAAESARAPPGTITDLCNSFTKLMSDSLYNEYDRHERDVRHALERRRAKMAFKVNDTSELLAEHDADAAADADAGLGVWNHGDRWQGDVNLRTLKTLLTRIDQRGFERSSQQLDFHEAFFNACSRVIYKSDWEVHKPEIMRKNNWKTVQSEVMISTPRRFGKTFSIAIFCACLALAFGVEIVVFRFVNLAGGSAKICEYNQEACRINSFDGRKSLVRSFPSKVAVRRGVLKRGGLQGSQKGARPPKRPSIPPCS